MHARPLRMLFSFLACIGAVLGPEIVQNASSASKFLSVWSHSFPLAKSSSFSRCHRWKTVSYLECSQEAMINLAKSKLAGAHTNNKSSRGRFSRDKAGVSTHLGDSPDMPGGGGILLYNITKKATQK